jgi:hypothetical protein
VPWFFQIVSVLRVVLPQLGMQLWDLPSVPHVIPISSALFNHSNRSKVMFSEEHRLRVFKQRVLLKIFVLTRDEVSGEWRKVQIEGLHYLYCHRISFR